jgi:hypothetical protein
VALRRRADDELARLAAVGSSENGGLGARRSCGPGLRPRRFPVARGPFCSCVHRADQPQRGSSRSPSCSPMCSMLARRSGSPARFSGWGAMVRPLSSSAESTRILLACPGARRGRRRARAIGWSGPQRTRMRSERWPLGGPLRPLGGTVPLDGGSWPRVVVRSEDKRGRGPGRRRAHSTGEQRKCYGEPMAAQRVMPAVEEGGDRHAADAVPPTGGPRPPRGRSPAVSAADPLGQRARECGRPRPARASIRCCRSRCGTAYSRGVHPLGARRRLRTTRWPLGQ